MSFYTTITTIQNPTSCVEELVNHLQKSNSFLIVAGDRKGPLSYDLPNTVFLDIENQIQSGFSLAKDLPERHYARKNIAYLRAIQEGASSIYETDDDNAPMIHWVPRSETVENLRKVDREWSKIRSPEWVNVYRYFTDESIWPRGLPLDEIHKPLPDVSALDSIRAPIQQGLVNHSPDVDAIWRLTQDRPFDFNQSPSIYLPPSLWCPFNTQSTWWWPIAYPLLYIPSYCSFRMCDIWKSFVAQRCLWELDVGIVFHAPEVRQERNEHDLMRDFRDEIPGYDRNNELIGALINSELKKGETAVAENLYSCYETLVEAGFFPEKELELVKAWIQDIGGNA